MDYWKPAAVVVAGLGLMWFRVKNAGTEARAIGEITQAKTDNSSPTKRKLVLIAVSGKRAAGKDTFSHILAPLFPSETTTTAAIANAFKRDFADRFHCDYERLLKDREYKEQWRTKMNDYFANEYLADGDLLKEVRTLVKNVPEHVKLVIVSDLRLKRDAAALRDLVDHCLLVRVNCNEELRKKFGWNPDPTVDNHFTETELDDYTNFDYVFQNEGNMECMHHHAAIIKEKLQKLLDQL